MDLGNVSILNLMPPNIAADKNVQMAAKAFDEVLRKIIVKIPNVEVIPNLVLNKIVNETLLDILAWQFHVDFYDPKMPIKTKRELVMSSLDWHFRKGTPSVVEDIVSTVFSKAIVQEWFEYDGLPYRFKIATVESMPDEETRSNLIRAINSVKNTRSLFETLQQLVYFIDKVYMSERQKTELRKKALTDNFSDSGRLRRNGRFRRDGTFVNTEEETFFIFRDSDFLRDGTLYRGENVRRVPSRDTIKPPFLRNTWNREHLSFVFNNGKFEERQLAQALRNTSLKRDSGIVRDGYSDKSFEDTQIKLGFNMAVSEKVSTSEQDDFAVVKEVSDTFIKRRDKTIRRDGGTFRGDKGVGETQKTKMILSDITETVSTNEALRLWIIKHHFRNTVFTRDDGKLRRDSMVPIPLE